MAHAMVSANILWRKKCLMSNSGKMVGVGPYSADLAAIKSLLTLRREARRKWMP